MQLFVSIVLIMSLIGRNQASFNCAIIPGNGTIDINDCSNFPIFIDEAITTKCSEDNPDTSDLPIATCTAQCLINATNTVVTETGGVNQQLFEDLIKSKSTGDWATVATTALDYCFKLGSVQDATLNGNSPESERSRCHPQAAVLISCLYLQLFVNTPTSAFNQKSISTCPELKEFVKNCAIE